MLNALSGNYKCFLKNLSNSCSMRDELDNPSLQNFMHNKPESIFVIVNNTIFIKSLTICIYVLFKRWMMIMLVL